MVKISLVFYIFEGDKKEKIKIEVTKMISTREATERYSKVGVVKGNLPTLKMLVLGL